MMSSAALNNEMVLLQIYVTMQNACFMHCLKRRNRRLLAFRGHSTVCQGRSVIMHCEQLRTNRVQDWLQGLPCRAQGRALP